MSLICLIPEPGAFYIMDRGHVDFERLFTLHRTGRFFVIRAKSNQIQASLLVGSGKFLNDGVVESPKRLQSTDPHSSQTHPYQLNIYHFRLVS